METRWLQDFLTLAELSNFTRAAATRNTSQAAFSRRIQSLEGWLGTALVDRSRFPTTLTPAGEAFRESAGEILRSVLEAKGALNGQPAPGQVRIAMPYALATACGPDWLTAWSDGRVSCSLELGNVHDMVSSLVAGTVDLLVCFHSAQQPIQLDPARYERVLLRTDQLRPYALEGALRGTPWPGRPDRRVPLLMYPTTVYFGRLVQLAIEQASEALHGRLVTECDMTDVLRGLALGGRGVAWLPTCSIGPEHAALRPVGAKSWGIEVATVALRDRTVRRPALDRFWGRLAATAGHHSRADNKLQG